MVGLLLIDLIVGNTLAAPRRRILGAEKGSVELEFGGVLGSWGWV